MKKVIVLLVLLTSQIQPQGIEFCLEGGLLYLNNPNNIVTFLPDAHKFGFDYQIGGKIKYQLYALPIKITTEIMYININSTDFKKATQPRMVEGNNIVNSYILSLQFGTEYYLFRNIISPFITGNIQMNYIGDTKWKFDDTYLISQEEATLKYGYRLGFSLGAGIETSFLNIFRISISSEYNIYNLLGKSNSIQYNYSSESLLKTSIYQDYKITEKTLDAITLNLGILYPL